MGEKKDKIETWSETPSLGPGRVGLIFPKYYYNVNVKRVSLSAAAAILDAVATFGLASASLSLSGLAKQGVAKLDTRSGEYCCLVHSAKLKQDQAEVSPEAVRTLVQGKPCPFVKLDCRLMREGVCNANGPDMASLFVALREKGALEEAGSQWSVPV